MLFLLVSRRVYSYTFFFFFKLRWSWKWALRLEQFERFFSSGGQRTWRPWFWKNNLKCGSSDQRTCFLFLSTIKAQTKGSYLWFWMLLIKCSQAHVVIFFIESCLFLIQCRLCNSFVDITCCRWCSPKIPCNCTLRNVLKPFDYFPEWWWFSPHPYLWRMEPFEEAPLIPNHDNITFY